MKNKAELKEMAPTRGSEGGSGHRGKGEDSGGKGKRAVTQAQLQAQVAAEAFKDRIPLISRLAMENMEKALWEQVKSKPIEEVREEVDGWVFDPESTARRASVHDRLVMIYWVLMNLVS